MPTNYKFYLIDGAPTQSNQAHKRESLASNDLTPQLETSLSRRRLDNTLSIQVPGKSYNDSQHNILSHKLSQPKIYEMDPK